MQQGSFSKLLLWAREAKKKFFASDRLCCWESATNSCSAMRFIFSLCRDFVKATRCLRPKFLFRSFLFGTFYLIFSLNSRIDVFGRVDSWNINPVRIKIKIGKLKKKNLKKIWKEKSQIEWNQKWWQIYAWNHRC